MAIEGEVMTIHQKIAQAQKEHNQKFGMGDDKPMKIFDAPKISDIQEIKQVLQYILDKMHSMDLYMRQHMTHKQYREFQSETERANKNAEALGLPGVKELNDAVKKELAKS